MEITRWERDELLGVKPSVEELIRIHQRLHQRDKFAQVMHQYPFGKDIMPKTIRALLPRTDYEFFLARFQESREIMGWIALSFNNEGRKAENWEMYEAKLEWTQMCSNILRGWKVDGAGEISNVWDTMKGGSSRLQAKNLPRHYCIINTLVVLPEYRSSRAVNGLVQHAIDYWRKRVAAGTEWAIWVQAPPFARDLYIRYGFEEVGEYEVDLGDYGYYRKEEREVFGKYNWKFMVRRQARITATWEPAGAEELDKGKGNERELEDAEENLATRREGKGKERESQDVEEHVASWEQGKGKSKEQESEDEEFVSMRELDRGKDKEQNSENVEEMVPMRNLDKGKGKEQRYHNFQAYETVHPAYGDPSISEAERIREWEEANKRLYGGPLESYAERTRAWEEANERLNDIHSAQARLLRQNDQLAGQQQIDYVPSESAESLIEAMRRGGVDEEEIERVKSLAISISEKAREG